MRLLLLLLIWILHLNALAQGCSDAGFCTLGAMRPNQPTLINNQPRLLSAEICFGKAATRFHDIIQNVNFDLNARISSTLSAQVKLPYMLVEGPLGKTAGFGDLSLSLSRKLFQNGGQSIGFTLGGKIPNGQPNRKSADDRPLPMYYQTTLGTYDIIAGLSYQNAHWLFAGGVQVPLNQAKSEFKWGAWKGDENEALARKYPVSAQIRRGSDWMLRLERNFRSSKWNGYLGLLSIYRFVPDRITLPATGARTYVYNSNGLVINVITGFGFQLTANQGIKLLAAYAPLKRKINPDGLSRDWVLSMAYEYRF